jgi:hypothetical protein
MDGPFPGGMPPAAARTSAARVPGWPDRRNTRARGPVGRRVPGTHGIARTGAWLRPAGHLR